VNLSSKNEALAAQIVDHLVTKAEVTGTQNRMGPAFILEAGSSEQVVAWLEKVFLDRSDLCEAFLNVPAEDRRELYALVVRRLALASAS
jgi:hypothetical protein